MNILSDHNLSILKNNEEQVNLYNENTKRIYTLGILEYKILLCYLQNHDLEAVSLAFPEINIAKLKQLITFFNQSLLQVENKKEYVFEMKKVRCVNIRIIKTVFGIIFILGPLLIALSLILLYLRPDFFTTVKMVYQSIFRERKFYLLVVIGSFTIISMILHECGHAIVAQYFKYNVNKVGLIIKPFRIYGFTEIPTLHIKDDNVKEKNMIFLAGILINIELASLGMILYYYFDFKYQYCLVLWIVVNIIGGMGNLILAKGFDGYAILETLLKKDVINKERIEELCKLYFLAYFIICLLLLLIHFVL